MSVYTVLTVIPEFFNYGKLYDSIDDHGLGYYVFR